MPPQIEKLIRQYHKQADIADRELRRLRGGCYEDHESPNEVVNLARRKLVDVRRIIENQLIVGWHESILELEKRILTMVPADAFAMEIERSKLRARINDVSDEVNRLLKI